MAGHLKRELAVAPLVQQLPGRGLFDRQSAGHKRPGRKPRILIRLLTFQTHTGDRLRPPKFLFGDDQVTGKTAENRAGGLKTVVSVRRRLLDGNLLEFTVQMLTSRNFAGGPGESSRRGFQVGVTAINALRRAKAKYAQAARFSMFSIYRHGRICSLFTIHD
jgi:hypothetical protein